MEHLPEDVMLTIVRKISASGTKNLFSFKATSTLPRDCLWSISDRWPCAAKHKFMQ